MTTERRIAARGGRRPRRRAAPASRILATGVSAATLLGLTAGWTAGSGDAPDAAAAVRVVVTDPRIDVTDAVGAALRAVDQGQDRAVVRVDGQAAAEDRLEISMTTATADGTTRAS